ncbi:hypothetical protein niasHS_000464 [Heterodera schachtii]|uniref:Uncharacterized protein n=1 Tax=Heterodera schachtii TaxID=97005 RepID=A0ABD2K708_HETSC
MGITLKLMENGKRNQRSWGFIHHFLPLIGITNIHKLYSSGAKRLRGLLASTSTTFLIDCPNLRSIYYDGNITGFELFQLDNKRTNERLALERIVLDQQSKVCMTRAPIGRDERKWAEWMRKAWEEEEPRNLLIFWISEANMGPDI